MLVIFKVKAKQENQTAILLGWSHPNLSFVYAVDL